MNKNGTGGIMMRGGIEDPRPLTTLERIGATIELAHSLQGTNQDERNRAMGNAMEEKAFHELVEFLSQDDAHRARRPFDRDDAAILAAARTVSPDAVLLGPQEPPQDYRIWNKRQPDGTFKPLSQFFDEAVQKADAVLTSGDLTRMAYGEDWMTEAIAREADAKDMEQTQEDARL